MDMHDKKYIHDSEHDSHEHEVDDDCHDHECHHHDHDHDEHDHDHECHHHHDHDEHDHDHECHHHHDHDDHDHECHHHHDHDDHDHKCHHHHHDHDEHDHECECHHHHHDHDDDCDDACCCCHHDEDEDEVSPKVIIIRLIIGAILAGVGAFLMHKGQMVPSIIVFVAGYLTVAYDILFSALKGLFKGRFLDENFLMAIASIGAMALMNFVEGIAVMIFYRIGELFEDYAVDKSRRNIKQLMDIRPDYANIEKDGQLITVAPEKVAVGSMIVVQPGERVPIDGVVEHGEALLDVSALTGESLPQKVTKGSSVLSGSIDTNSVLHIKTTNSFGDSTLSKIFKLVGESSARKAKAENFIRKFAKIYTPAVCISAVLVALLPPVLNLLMGNDADFGTWVYRALTFLVISCPCALVIGIPLTFFAGIGCASRNSILIKGSNYIEALSKAKTVVLDKTGTITMGVFEVADIRPVGYTKDQLLELAAYAESSSSHPIAKSLLKAYNKPVNRDRIESIEEISGNGVIAKLNVTDNTGAPVTVAAGNEKLMVLQNIPFTKTDAHGTIVYIAINNVYSGYIVISDLVKPDSQEAIKKLKACGIRKIVMLTGDNHSAAESIAKAVDIDEVHSMLLPSDKVGIVESLINAKENKSDAVIFVGDGINDAPVLSRADVGISMGCTGSDAAIEASDAVLMDDSLTKVSTAIGISRKTIRIVYENIIFALTVKISCMILGALGISNIWLAIFADVGVMVIAVLNAMRALKFKEKK